MDKETKKLPEGKICADCGWYVRCLQLPDINLQGHETVCFFDLSGFVPIDYDRLIGSVPPLQVLRKRYRSWSEVARRLGISRRQMSRYQDGEKISTPMRLLIAKIATGE